MRKLLIGLFILLTFCQIAYADKQEWVDKNYDFKKVTTVAVLEPVIAGDIKNGISEKEISDIFQEKLKFPDNIKVLRLADIVALIKADTGQDVWEVYKHDNAAGEKMLTEGIVKHADLLVLTDVDKYGMISVYSSGYTYETTENKTSYVNQSGKAPISIQTPVTTQHTVEGGYVNMGCAKTRFTVKDTKTSKEVFLRIQVESGSQPKNVFSNIMKSFFKDLGKKLK